MDCRTQETFEAVLTVHEYLTTLPNIPKGKRERLSARIKEWLRSLTWLPVPVTGE